MTQIPTSLSGTMSFLASIDSKFKEPSKEKLCPFPSEDGFSGIGADGPVETDHSFSMYMYEQKKSSLVPSSLNSPNVSGRSISSGRRNWTYECARRQYRSSNDIVVSRLARCGHWLDIVFEGTSISWIVILFVSRTHSLYLSRNVSNFELFWTRHSAYLHIPSLPAFRSVIRVKRFAIVRDGNL